MTKSDIVMLVLLLLALSGLGYLFFFAEQAPETEYYQIEVTGSSLTAKAYPSLTFADISGTIVRGGFVTIHESIGPAPGPVIGTSEYLAPGEYTDKSIVVTPAMLPGYNYIALLHVDDGDQAFEMQEDMPVTSNGQVVRWDFIAEAEANEE